MSNTTICLDYFLKILTYLFIIMLVSGLFVPKKLIVYHLTFCLIFLYSIDNNKSFLIRNGYLLQNNEYSKLIVLFIMSISIYNYISKYNITLIFNKVTSLLDELFQIHNNELTLKYKLNFNKQDINITGGSQSISSVTPILKFYDKSNKDELRNYFNINKILS